MIDVYCDGAGKNPKGIGSASFCIVKDKYIVYQKSVLLKDKTSNEAEYFAILEAIHCISPSTNFVKELAHERQYTIHTDSELVFKQLTGEYAIKEPRLQALKDVIDHDLQIAGLRSLGGSVTFDWVPRENDWIKKVDQMNRNLVKKVTQ